MQTLVDSNSPGGRDDIAGELCGDGRRDRHAGTKPDVRLHTRRPGGMGSKAYLPRPRPPAVFAPELQSRVVAAVRHPLPALVDNHHDPAPVDPGPFQTADEP